MNAISRVGNDLEADVGVELLNVLRPTVAVSVFIVHAVHALNRYPEWVQRLKDDAAPLYR